MLDRYIVVKDKDILVGQTSKGSWYCKELPCKDIGEMELLIGEVNRVLNIFNQDKIKKEKK